MNKTIFLYAILVTLTGACATQTTKEYVDKRDAANLVDSKSYTDVKVSELARDLPTKDTLKPLVEDIIKTNIFPWAREKTKPIYTPEEIGALPDTTVIPTKVSDISNDLEFVTKSVFDSAVAGKMSMTNRSGSAYIGWMEPNIFFGKGSFVFGKDCEVEQYYCFASGEGTKALGKNSHSEGMKTTASGNYSHAEGYGTTASGDYSKASGNYTTSSGVSTHAEGYYSHAEGESTHAEGFSTHAEGFYSHAEGGYTHVEGFYTHAEGCRTHADGSSTHAEGGYTHAEGGYTHAEGKYTHAEGYRTHASTFASKAEGINSQATNRTSFVWQGTDIGDDSYIDHSAVPPYGSHGPGTFNLNPFGGIEGFYIGEKTLSEIFYTKDETDDKVAESAPGNRNYVQIGTNAYATAREDGGAIAIGENAKALGYRSISIGGGTELNKAVAEKSGAIQLGSGVNSSNNTFQVYGYRMLDANGYIPKERIAQTTLMLYDEKNSITWQMGVDPNTGDMMWYAVTNVDITGTVRSIPEDKNYVPIQIQ